MMMQVLLLHIAVNENDDFMLLSEVHVVVDTVYTELSSMPV
jgi:hypothetical protein